MLRGHFQPVRLLELRGERRRCLGNHDDLRHSSAVFPAGEVEAHSRTGILDRSRRDLVDRARLPPEHHAPEVLIAVDEELETRIARTHHRPGVPVLQNRVPSDSHTRSHQEPQRTHAGRSPQPFATQDSSTDPRERRLDRIRESGLTPCPKRRRAPRRRLRYRFHFRKERSRLLGWNGPRDQKGDRPRRMSLDPIDPDAGSRSRRRP